MVFLWDFDPDRERILRGQWPTSPGLTVLDEIHKHRPWRNLARDSSTSAVGRSSFS